MVINTNSNKDKPDARLIRQAVLRANLPYFTTISGAKSAALALKARGAKDAAPSIGALQDYLSGL